MTFQRLRHAGRPRRRALELPFFIRALTLGLALALSAGCGHSASSVPAGDAGDASTSCTGPNCGDAGEASTSCTAASQCDDANLCTTDTCGGDGRCVHTAVADGPLPAADQTPGNCKVTVCTGGAPKTEDDDTNTPKSSGPCVVEGCSMGTALADVTTNDGAACTIDGTPGACSNGVCTVACTSASDCPSTNPCSVASCNEGACLFTNVADGTPTPGVTEPIGTCMTQVCVGGVNTAKEDDANGPPVPAALAGCADAVCTMGVPSNPLHAVDSGCSSYMGTMPGFCSAAGSCVQCTQDSECPGVSDDCGHPACTNNACTMVYAANGTPTVSNPLQVTGTCSEIVCDGAGGHMTIEDDTGAAVPSAGSVCVTDSCSGGNVVMTPNPGVVCSPSMEKCSTTGLCGCQSNADCTAPQTCGGGGTPLFCGCTPATCATLGKTCGGPFPDGCGNTLNCNDGADDGTETATDCGGVTAPNSTCGDTCAEGLTCKVGSDCTSGFCVDGVCCNTACTGLTCQACSASAKGQGADGVCGAVAVGRDPHSNCATTPASSCGESGGCNGAGACTTYAAGTVCEPASCTSATVLSLAETCSTGMMCKAPAQPTEDCTPYLCSGGACTTTCTSDAQCAASAYCSTAAGANHDTCLLKVVSGTCSANDQCADGVCGTNGVCCATTCPLGGTCGNTGACAAGTGACIVAASGTACGSASCSGTTFTQMGSCNGAGTCNPGSQMTCAGNFACSGSACRTTCTPGSSVGCASNAYTCNGAGTACLLDTGASCVSNGACASGICGASGSGHCCAATCVTAGACGAMDCDATGACEYSSGGCSSAQFCSSATVLSQYTTCSIGSCSGGLMTTVCPGVCVSTASPPQCGCGTDDAVGDARCPPMTWCDGVNAGTCQSPAGAGSPCTRDSQCTVGCDLGTDTCS